MQQYKNMNNKTIQKGVGRQLHWGSSLFLTSVNNYFSKVSDEAALEQLYMLVYDNFIEEIDAIDNGVSC